MSQNSMYFCKKSRLMRKYIHYISIFLLLSIFAAFPQAITAQTDTTSSYLLMPLVFDKQQAAQEVSPSGATTSQGLTTAYDWIGKAQQRWGRVHDMRYRLMIDTPGLVKFNEDQLPKPPKEVVVETDPSATELQVEAPKIDGEKFRPVDRREMKMHNWLHSFVGSLHGTQAYISNNWYQGGENNLNLLADVQWDCNLNQKFHPNWLFNNTLHYRLGVATAKGDSLRSYCINEDNFQFDSQLGYKAVKNWYYSLNLLFKTQLLNNYVTNTRKLSPLAVATPNR